MSNSARKLLGATAAAEDIDISDYFSTYLYTGNGSTQTITNGIDLAGEGGLVWIKKRSGTDNHALLDTNRGVGKIISSNTTDAEFTAAASVTSFNSDGFNLGNYGWVNGGASTYASWTFRKAKRFFDVVTYTGNGANRTVAHNLGVVPGCIIVKRTDTTGDWQVYHRSNTAAPETDYLVLNSTAATVDDNTRWNDTLPTSTVFSLGTNATVNASGGTYVAYLFAHDPLGPSGDGSDGLIACGSFTTDGSGNATVNLGWEPQWVLYKRSDGAGFWFTYDTMRGFSVGLSNDSLLYANLADAEIAGANGGQPYPTGFSVSSFLSGQTYIYIAIRRGPMREPTSGTEVFAPVAYTGDAVDNRVITTGFPVDYLFATSRALLNNDGNVFDRMRGAKQRLVTQSTIAESTMAANYYVDGLDSNTGFILGGSGGLNSNGTTFISHAFRRAPGFFDVVAYTGTGSNRTVTHNLGAVPELMIVKKRSAADDWAVYYGDNTDYLLLNSAAATVDDITYWNDTSPTSSVFTVGTNTDVNTNTATYIAYLFATLPGISKIGTYTGNGSTQTIDCGFTAGARFVLIKRIDQPDAWYVWDTARGIVAGNDPYLQLNSTAAEVTSTDHIDPANSGFTLATSFVGTNNSAGTYLYLAIA